LNHLFLLAACLGVGALSGFLGGLLGIGGGVVIVPALIVLFDVTGLFEPGPATVVAVATSLGCIVFTSASAALAQLRAGMVEWLVVRRWVAFLVLGSAVAGTLAAGLPTTLFRAFIGAFLLFVAFVMLTSWKPAPHRGLPGPGLSAGLGTTAGLVAGTAGIAGGNVIVPTLVYFNTPVHRATATSSTLGVPVALAGVSGYVAAGWGAPPLPQGDGLLSGAGWMLGYLYVPAFLAIVVATVATAPLGVRAAHRIAPAQLRRAFGVLLIVVATRMLYSALSIS
jgi:uncharacterized membrane protein YfcA